MSFLKLSLHSELAPVTAKASKIRSTYHAPQFRRDLGYTPCGIGISTFSIVMVVLCGLRQQPRYLEASEHQNEGNKSRRVSTICYQPHFDSWTRGMF